MMLFQIFTVRPVENPRHEIPLVQYEDYYIFATSLSNAWDRIKNDPRVIGAAEAWGRPLDSEDGSIVLCPYTMINQQQLLSYHASFRSYPDTHIQLYAGPESLRQHYDRVRSALRGAVALSCGSDGTVTDTRTGLMWMRPLLGQYINGRGDTRGIAATMPLDDALAAAAACRFSGYHDWRVPTIDELKSLTVTPNVCSWQIDKQIFRESLDELAVGELNCDMLSSSPVAGNEAFLYNLVVGFGVGANPRTADFLSVRLVRNVT